MRLKFRLANGKVIGYKKIGSLEEIPQVQQDVSFDGRNYTVQSVSVRSDDLYQVIVVEKPLGMIQRILRFRR
jgi:hypothetical protein